MTDWRRRTIGSLLLGTVDYRGKTPPASQSGIPTISAKHVKRGRVVHCGERYVTQDTYDGWTTRGFIKPGDVLITTEAPVGEVARVPGDQTYLITRRVIALQVDPHEGDERFLMYSMLSERNRLRLANLAHGATVPRVFKEDILGFELEAPDVQTQQRIGAVLGSIDDLIENNRRRIEVLEEIAQAIYREWFVHFRFPGHENTTFVDSPLGPIPEGWEVHSFSEMATFTNGFAFKPSHWTDCGRPIIKIKELKGGVTRETPRCDEAEIKEKYWIEPGDLLFSWSADLGVYRWSGEPGLLNQHLFIVQPTTETSGVYIQHALTGALPKFWDRAQGTTMRHIKRSALTEVTTIVPPASIDSGFNSRVAPLDELGLRLVQTNRVLAAMRDLLLPRLVTGEIDVSDLDLDGLVGAAS